MFHHGSINHHHTSARQRPLAPLCPVRIHCFIFSNFRCCRRRGFAPTRAHHQNWNVYGLTKSPRTAETGEKHLLLTRAVSLCNVVLTPPCNRLTVNKHNKNRRTQTSQLKLKRIEKRSKKGPSSYFLSDLLSKLQPVAYTPFSLFSLTTSLSFTGTARPQ